MEIYWSRMYINIMKQYLAALCLIQYEANTFALFKNKYFLNLLDWTFF